MVAVLSIMTPHRLSNWRPRNAHSKYNTCQINARICAGWNSKTCLVVLLENTLLFVVSWCPARTIVRSKSKMDSNLLNSTPQAGTASVTATIPPPLKQWPHAERHIHGGVLLSCRHTWAPHHQVMWALNHVHTFSEVERVRQVEVLLLLMT